MHEVAFNVMSKAGGGGGGGGWISMQNEKFDDNLKTTVK